MKRKLINSLRLLLVAAGLCMGGNAWGADVYTIIYGTPTYAGDGITVNGVTPQTDFTSADGSTASDVTSSDANGDNCTNAMPIGGSVLYSNSAFTHNFTTAPTKGIVHFEANYTTTTNGQETWQILDSNGVEIFGTTDAGYSNGNATKIWGFCNGASLGTNWFRQARSTHNRVVLDINFTTRKVSYTVLVSSGNNSYSTLTGTYDLPAAVNDVKGLKANKQTYYSYMDNVSFYNVYDDAVTLYDYTINYKLSEDVVKTVSASATAGTVIIAETALDGEGTYAGNHYLITAADAPTMTITSGTNVLDVPVRAPYTATLNVTRTIGGVAQTPVAKNLTETDAKVCAWTYTYPMYVQKDGVYYVADETSSFGESGTFTNGETINKTVAYTNPDYSVVYFDEPNEVTGTNTAYSNGATGFITGGVSYGDNRVIRLGQLQAGTYRLITNITGDANRNLVVGDYTAGTESFPTALVTITTTGAKDETFTADGTQFISISGKDQGSGKFNQSSTFDYILVKAVSVSATIGSHGYATFSSTCGLDFTDVTEATAYIATEKSGDKIMMQAITGEVAANTGLVLKSASGSSATIDIPVAASGTTYNTTSDPVNYLFAISSNYNLGMPGTGTNYVLSVQDEKVVFAPIGATVAPVTAGHAALWIPAVGARMLEMSFADDETTGISQIENGRLNIENSVYNLNGQRVTKPSKGLYIVGGKKVILK